MVRHWSQLIGDRLTGFVGRGQELTEIQGLIAERMQTGGYVTITGQAGQGKTSLMAKLVSEYGVEIAAHHFIRLNPGSDEQVNLLRNLMARLILKHNLSDIYVASENRAVLRESFRELLADIASGGGREVLFIDGLDQLEEELSGGRDLSFLPLDPPAGLVFVMAPRPNDTLKPIELVKSRVTYPLPDMSRGDFALLLARRNARVDPALADRFYVSMQRNALYLDLVAQELTEDDSDAPDEIIRRVAGDPNNLFSFAIERFKRHGDQWRNVLRPMQGLLLASREPLSLVAIRQLLSQTSEALQDGIQRLGGLVVSDGNGRYSLYHLKLQEYLRQDERQPSRNHVFVADDEEELHRRLAQWVRRYA